MPYFSKRIKPLLILACSSTVLFLIAGACTLELTEQAGEIRVPVSGLWIARTEEPEHTIVLYITSPGDGDYPFRFTMLELYKRSLLVSGRRIFVNKRIGQISSSPNQLLLYQDVYTSGYYDVQGKAPAPWAVSGFSRFVTERAIKKQKPLMLLHLSEDGNTLEGFDYPFRRALLSPKSGLHLAETDVGLVLEVYPDKKTLSYLSFSPSLSVLKSKRKLYPQKGQAETKRAPTLVITKIYDVFGEALLQKGEAQAGDLLVLPNFRPGKASRRRRLSKSEVLRRIQRGEHVPREDLIRVLGEKKK